MRIGFDLSQAGTQKAGCGWFARSLLDSLVEGSPKDFRWLVYPTFGSSYWDPNWKQSVRAVEVPSLEIVATPSTLGEARNFWAGDPKEIHQRLGAPDLIHANNFFCPPRLPECRIVFTLHDLSFLDFPEYTSEANRLICFQGVYEAALRADFIISVSSFSRRRFLEYFPHFSPQRIAVIHPASRFPLKEGDAPQPVAGLEPDQFWLSVGTLEPRKNHAGLIQAYREFASGTANPGPLVLAGKRGWLLEELEALLESSGPGRILPLGYVEDSELAWLYANCRAFLYPSFYEGFGMPVLEAMSMGAPVLVSETSSLPEVAGRDAVLIDPQKPDSILSGILQLHEDDAKRRQLKLKSLERSARFDWEDAAGRTRAIYQQLLKEGTRPADR